MKKKLINNIFNSLRRSHIKYIILRGYEKLPNIVSNDIDILVNDKDLTNCINNILNEAKNNNWILTHVKQRHGIHKVILYGNTGDTLEIDLFYKINWKGFDFVDPNYLFRNTKVYNGFVVLKEGSEAAIVLLKELLMNKKLKSWGAAHERLTHCVRIDEDGFKSSLLGFLSNNKVDLLTRQIEDKSWVNIERSANSIRKDIVKYNLLKYKFKCIRNTIQWVKLVIKDKLSLKTGVFLAIIGPDGSGKTTLVDEVCSTLGTGDTPRIFSQTHHMKSNFEILPRLSTLANFLSFKSNKAKIKRNTEGFQGYHSGMEGEPNSLLRSFIYISWYSLDLFIGRLVILRRKSKGELIFFARYYYDYYYQRGNKNIPKWFLKLFEIFIPTPDLVFYISRTPGDIYKLKPELSLDEISRQQRIIHDLSKNNTNFIEIDGMKGIDSSKDQIVIQILKLLSERYKHV